MFPFSVCVCFAMNMGKAGRTVEAYNEHRSGKYIKYLSVSQPQQAIKFSLAGEKKKSLLHQIAVSGNVWGGLADHYENETGEDTVKGGEREEERQGAKEIREKCTV